MVCLHIENTANPIFMTRLFANVHFQPFFAVQSKLLFAILPRQIPKYRQKQNRRCVRRKGRFSFVLCHKLLRRDFSLRGFRYSVLSKF